MNLFFALVVALEAPTQKVFDALTERDCPHLHAMLTAEFQAQVPAATLPGLCNAVGPAEEITAQGDEQGLAIYQVKSKTGLWRVGLALHPNGRVAGLMVTRWRAPETAKSLDEKLAQVGARDGLPGIAALALENGRVTQRAIFGVRKLGDKTAIGSDDRWHLGSDTKAMTATLAALLVKDGKLAWTSSFASVTGWKDVHPALASATLEALLTHLAGLPHGPPEDAWKAMWKASNPAQSLEDAVHVSFRQAPEKVGTYQYSNLGYMAAGVMLQKASGETWEALMRKRLFVPLGMTSCGFGAPATAGKIDAPWAHRAEKDKLVPVEPGPDSDNPRGLGPAGTVHCSLDDWAKLVQEHVRGELGEPTTLPLSGAEFHKLHEPPAGSAYAFGWGTSKLPGGGVALSHDGSNTMFYASVVAVPPKGRVFLVATNRGDDQAGRAVQDIMRYLRQTANEPSPPPSGSR